MKLIEAAVRLYTINSRLESDHWLKSMSCIHKGTERPSAIEYRSGKVWFWAIKRWGREFTSLEFELRDQIDDQHKQYKR